MNTKIIGTGLNGLVGSRIVELLQDRYELENISRSTGVDITDQAQVDTVISSSKASVVLHLTAKTDVDGCERDKERDIAIAKIPGTGQELFKNTDTAWAINVVGTQNVVEACKKTDKKLIYFSTDFVFDGENPSDGGYKEEDKPNPINWYGLTKHKGEDIILNSGIPFVIIRLAYPFGPFNSEAHPGPFLNGDKGKKKKDFVRAILSRLQKGEVVSGITDHIFAPTFIDDIAKVLNVVISSKTEGIYHAVGSQALTPYEVSLMIAKKFNFPESLIEKTTRDEYFQGRAERPCNLSLRNDKIRQIGVAMRRFEDALELISK